MNPAQIVAISSMIQTASDAGLVLIGGVRQLIEILHAAPSEAELATIEAAVVADAAARKAARDKM